MIKKIIKYFFITLVISAITIFFFIRVACPIVHDIPAPAGPFAVGIKNFHWNDNSENAFNVDIFYPSSLDKNNLAQMPYQPQKIEILKNYLSEKFKIPHVVSHYMFKDIKDYVQPNAPLAETLSGFPLVIYLPGIGSDDLHNVYLEQLASHGYIVVAIEPPGDILFTLFPNNHLVKLNIRKGDCRK